MKFIAKTLVSVAVSLLMILWICNMLGIGEDSILKWLTNFKDYVISTFS